MWKHTDTVIYYISPKFTYSSSVAVFSFVNTLICKEYYAKSNYNVQLWNDKVLNKLTEIHDKGASLVVIDTMINENFEHVKIIFDKFMTLVNLPFVAFFTTKYNKYNKPNTNIWKLLEVLYKREKRKINLETSIYVGDKAGRLKTDRTKLDYSSIDRAFAENVKLTFLTPDRFFLGYSLSNLWQWGTRIINKHKRDEIYKDSQKQQVPVILTELSTLPESKIYTIIITGPPSSGKTTLAKKIKRKWDGDCIDKGEIMHITENLCEDIYHLTEQMDIYLSEGKSVVVDTAYYGSKLTQMVKTSMSNKVPILILKMKVHQEVAKLLDCIKVQTAINSNIVTTTAYQWCAYFNYYIEPEYENLPCVKCVDFPLVINIADEFWYSYC